LLFLFFINDIIDDISTDTADGIVTLIDYLIYLILFADDTVLFGKTPEILQHLLDKLFIYCRKWNIEVNTDKTKVVVFRNSWRLVNDHFFYDNMELKIVDYYVYLGMSLHFNGKFLQTEKNDYVLLQYHEHDENPIFLTHNSERNQPYCQITCTVVQLKYKHF
jgi:hypothetical protein